MSTCTNCDTTLPDDAEFCPECGRKVGAVYSPAQTIGGLETVMPDNGKPTPSDTPMSVLSPGTIFAERYTIEGILGQGGMGVVYRAKDSASGETIALKLIHPNKIAGEKALQRLIEEGVITRKLRHPNIVAVYDVGAVNGQPYVTMEYVEGTSLRQWQRAMMQKQRDISYNVAARIVYEILEGLEAAHKAGVVHRDLKPENIILLDEPSAEGVSLRILDFGIARATKATTQADTGTGLGTPGYMAPEQRTNPDMVTPAADLFSVSVIFYELLVEVLPQGHWQAPSGGRSDVPPAIDALIESGLSLRPSNRPQSVAEYRKAAAQTGKKTLTPEPKTEKTKLPKWAIWSGAAVAGLVVVAMLSLLPVDEDEDSLNPCDGLSGSDYRDCIGVDDVEEEVVRRNTTPQNPYARLSGPWKDDWGSRFNIQVAPSGVLSGSGYGPDGSRLQLSGQLSTTPVTGQISAPAMGMTFVTQLRWDGGCHIDYVTYNRDGSINLTGRFHANHEPGAPCP
ncbi:serine/threonine-protein kinase [Henriciella litoralis]|uniref:serine/threonine-protein kinase n=1 Tax=Henriciella litoralis TaxID=568102 RepID=UPI000A065278|nr:serine/threonine-protein kinase [Henriciella litoralis]